MSRGENVHASIAESDYYNFDKLLVHSMEQFQRRAKSHSLLLEKPYSDTHMQSIKYKMVSIV